MMRLVLAVMALWILAALPAQAVECEGPLYRGAGPKINLVHIFCGQIRHGTPDGYHSEIQQPTPSVAGVIQTRPARAQPGIYEGEVQFRNGRTKWSSFFPKHCTQAQIEASIRYAAHQPLRPKTGSWGDLAASAPAGGGAAFCTDDNGLPFPIRYALGNRGDVATAFPDTD